MSFKERSAWIMALAMGLVGGWYVLTLWKTGGTAPMLPALVAYIICLTVLSVVGHTAAAMLSPGDAKAGDDERDRQIAARAGNVGGFVFGFSVVCALGWYLFDRDGDLLFHLVFASLALGQFATSLTQIALYRRGG